MTIRRDQSPFLQRFYEAINELAKIILPWFDFNNIRSSHNLDMSALVACTKLWPYSIYFCIRATWIFTRLGLRAPEPFTWWRHQMETFSASLALYAGNSPVTGEFPAQRPVTWSFDIFFDLRLNKRLSKPWGWWSETPSRSLWRHCNVTNGRWLTHVHVSVNDFTISLRNGLSPVCCQAITSIYHPANI